MLFRSKVERGKYRVVSPEQLFKNRVNISKSYDFLKKIELKYSLTGSDAVFLWTKGGYQVGRFFGFYPIYIKILMSDLKKWKQLLKSNNLNYFIQGKEMQNIYKFSFSKYSIQISRLLNYAVRRGNGNEISDFALRNVSYLSKILIND